MANSTSAAARILTERDISILRWVGGGGIASLDQRARQFWAGGRVATAQERLAQLVRAGYLQMQWSQHRGAPERVYTLAPRGYAQLPRVVQERVRIGFPPGATIRQQLWAAEARGQLTAAIEARGGQVLDWRAEHELRSEYNRAVALADRRGTMRPCYELADAQIIVETATGQRSTIDIEIDGEYFGTMLRRKVARMGQSGRLTYWVCEARRAARLRQVCAAYADIRIWSLR